MKPTNNIGIWFFPNTGKIEPITSEEVNISKSMSPVRAMEYKRSRGYIRKVLSKIYEKEPLDIDVTTLPGKPPLLIGEEGYISLSHCNDPILIGWSTEKIGIDIERKDRDIKYHKIMEKYYSEHEIQNIFNLKNNKQQLEFKKYWILKEAAIKWQRGNIAKEIKHWEIINKKKNALNTNLNQYLNTHIIEYKFWLLGLAVKSDFALIDPLLCSS